MAETFVGVFPVYGIKFEVDLNGSVGTPNWKEIADMETAGLNIDTGVETWFSITEDGWQRAIATSKAFTLSMNGKRTVGDAGNDYIASKWQANGRSCDSRLRMTFPNGDILTAGVVISVTSFGGGDASNVAPLEFDLTSNGKPQFTTGSVTLTFDKNGATGTAPTSITYTGTPVTLPSAGTMTNSGKVLAGWAESATGFKVVYPAGAAYVPGGNAILYAVWVS